MKIEERRKLEQEKYLKLFAQEGYGSFNHGKPAMPFIAERFNESQDDWEDVSFWKNLLDVGCGSGAFCLQNEKYPYEEIIGMDFASIPEEGVEYSKQLKFIRGDALDIPYPDNYFELITSFDVLEHLLPEDVGFALNELKRVCSGEMLLKPAYRESHAKGVEGEDLHPTVKPESWWIEMIEKTGVQSVNVIQRWYDEEGVRSSLIHVVV